MLLPTTLDKLATRMLRAFGYTLTKRKRLLMPLDRRQRLMEFHSIDLVIDVGANTGQYGKSLRNLGYRGSIVSFEPMAHAFRELNTTARSDGNWVALHSGLGDSEEDVELHISENSISSFILPMLSTHEKFAPNSRYIASEKIHVSTLDNVFEEISGDARNIWLKLDVQGYENRVLHGAKACLQRMKLIQLELSFRPLYSDQTNFTETCCMLESFGFDLVGIEPGFMDYSTGELLQADGIFLFRGKK
ncbi:FkbM family methyltransferase [Rhodanobacter sp. Si-c]|uniref:FkbM family methyltransferase n=1 Tax=Rhodanobacter lycopersici TaxID=3162487 RepID=A0ABV3QC56_9GAMM